MKILQKGIVISSKKRGIHLITNEVLKNIPEIKEIKKGIAFINIMHTSASLSINENADPTVRRDLEKFLTSMVPEEIDLYEHTYEGPDDMTAHIKSTIIGNSITIPITNGNFNLGVWQGIYLCEHRNNSGERHLIITILGE